MQNYLLIIADICGTLATGMTMWVHYNRGGQGGEKKKNVGRGCNGLGVLAARPH